ncbi:DUF2721 domain-containing protein [Methylobacillus flagellatus]|uniref:DUF2721 domain-containing protein n=1 Tax=Methylobacillus flagellatus (strain ATCC 51484 / DSM 6875 / VKM B-1610 / KT) TaxID=265072 RepID=Q1GYP4_METFK|nr:DUF2721 domain-containing protein [Methylobacillus flagellatus]ABE50643.1 conserved hypothetical protein [Methylobacillus flagellatus KT]
MLPVPDVLNVANVANVIQLAVAPAFLLTGSGAMLGVMAGRLARVVDRFRELHESGGWDHAQKSQEMHRLLRRSRWIHRAISLTSLAALLVCVVIATLFAAAEVGWNPSRIVSLLFICAMGSLVFGLLCFLREIALSTDIMEDVRTREGGR